MAILTNKDILALIESGELAVDPEIDRFQLQGHAIDLRLGFTYLLPKLWRLTKEGRVAMQMDHYNLKRPDYFDVLELEKGQYFDLLPNESIMVSTLENLKLPNNIMGVMYPRSSVNRKGLSVDITGIVDAGYEGQLTIPIRNNTAAQVIRLYPGERVCQIVFEELTAAIKIRKSRYHKKDIIEGVSVGTLPGERKGEIASILKGDIKELKTKYRLKKRLD